MRGKIIYKRKLNAETGEFEDVPEYFIGGQQVSAAEYKAAFPDRPVGVFGGQPLTGWPILSDALKVHPNSRQKGIDDANAKKVPTDFTTDGRPIFRSETHMREYMRAYGYHRNNCFYS